MACGAKEAAGGRGWGLLKEKRGGPRPEEGALGRQNEDEDGRVGPEVGSRAGTPLRQGSTPNSSALHRAHL